MSINPSAVVPSLVYKGKPVVESKVGNVINSNEVNQNHLTVTVLITLAQPYFAGHLHIYSGQHQQRPQTPGSGWGAAAERVEYGGPTLHRLQCREGFHGPNRLHEQGECE